jgi:hypothetical protein
MNHRIARLSVAAGPVLFAAALGAAFTLGAPASASASASAPAPASGNVLGGIDLDFNALSRASAGAWADYTMTVPGRTETPTIRYALVEKTGTRLSVEVDSPTPKGELDMRFDFGPVGADAWKLTGGKMRFGEESADVPPQQLAGLPPVKKGAPPGELLGNEDVKTPAGAFTCRHYRKAMGEGKAIELWMSEKALPTGLVKSTIGLITMTLGAMGQGAKSKIK